MSTTIAQNSFLPTSIPGCQIWLDGADPAGTGIAPINGSSISTWADKSGNAKSATATAGNATFSAAALNGRGVLAFGGAAYLTSPLSMATTTPLTYFAVARPNVTGGFYAVSAINGGPTIVRPNTLMLYKAFNDYWWFSGGTGAVDGNTVTLLSSTSRYDINANYWSPSYTQMTINGTSYASSTAAPSSLANGGTLLIAAASGSPPYEIWNGLIAELIIYNSALTTLQRQQVEGYLAWTWDLVANLPSNHPYKNTPAVIITQPSTLAVLSITNRFTNASFLPTQIPGCKLWLDAADTSPASMTLSGTTLTTWKDKSGNGLNMTAGGNYPTYTKTGIQFNGGVPNVLSNSTGYSATTALTAFVVYQSTVSSSRQRYFKCAKNGNYSFVSTDTTYIDLSTTTTNNYNGPISYSANTTYIISVVPYSSSSLAYAINGTESFSWIYSASSTPYAGATELEVGGVSTVYFTGYIMEVIMYDAYFTPTQRQQVEGYLAWKWGLNANLPPTHPYKNTSAVFVTQPTTLAILGANPYNNKTGFGTFKSKSISSLQFWLDAADTSSITFTSSNTISAWNDKSGNGFNLYQATSSNQPTYFSNYITLGTASNYYMNMPQGAVNNASTWSMFFVINPINSTNWIMAKQWDGVNSLNILSMTYNGYRSSGTTGVVYFKPQNSATLFSGPAALATSTVQMVSMSYDGTNMYYYLNGNLGSTTAGTFGIINVGSATTCTLGAWVVAGGLEYSGTTNFKLGELQFFNTALTTSQRQQTEGYLAWKWGLQGSLPANHPYKSFSPPP